MHYTAKIVSEEEQKKLFGKPHLHFYQGFVNEPRVDWLNILGKNFGQPVVLIRPAWKNIIVLLADGSISDGKRFLDYESESDLEFVLSDIFKEAQNDEYEVFESYAPGPKCPSEVWDAVREWVSENY